MEEPKPEAQGGESEAGVEAAMPEVVSEKFPEIPEETAEETKTIEDVQNIIGQMSRPNNSQDILRLNDDEIGITSTDSEDAKWGYLAGAARRHQILTGVVSTSLTTSDGLMVCVLDCEGMRVLVPYREMVFDEWPSDEPVPASVRLRMQRILGAKVEFIPSAVDIRNRAAVGSRKAAMLQRQKQYYESGRVQPGILIACRVLAVGSRMMTVEACGVESVIYARDVAWEWFTDIGDLYSTGDLIVARVMEVKQDKKTERYSVTLSVKASTVRQDSATFKTLTPNTNYFGVVTGVRNGFYFVRLQSGANAKTKLFRCRERPCRLDTVSFRITKLDQENLVANGYITRIIKKHTRLG